jgi:hypothetical protein
MSLSGIKKHQNATTFLAGKPLSPEYLTTLQDGVSQAANLPCGLRFIKPYLQSEFMKVTLCCDNTG